MPKEYILISIVNVPVSIFVTYATFYLVQTISRNPGSN